MDPSELLRLLVETLERLDIKYAITGGFAAIAYSEFRTTQDIDVVIDIRYGQVDPLREAFGGEDFYLAEEAMRHAVAHGGMFNVIHLPSGLKLDLTISKLEPVDEIRFSRRERVEIGGVEAWLLSPEDVILSKLEWVRMGAGEKQLRDCASIVRVQGPDLDRAYIAQWAPRLGVERLWERVREVADRPDDPPGR